MNEADLERNIREYAQLMGWLLYHTHDSRRSPSGFPDIVLVRPPRVIFVELKSPVGRVTREQGAWLAALELCPDVETYLWRPADWDTITEVLSRRAPTRPATEGNLHKNRR